MTHITCSFPSFSLGTMAKFHIILPRQYGIITESDKDNVNAIPESGYRTLYLLHGICDSASDWLLHSRASELADKYHIAIVLPSVGNSFYLDGINAVNAFTFLTDELLNYVRDIFPLSRKREDTFLCGYSMGGYGAVRTGLLCPNIFGKIISLSGALDIYYATKFVNICGYLLPPELLSSNELQDTDKDIFYLLTQTEYSAEQLPDFYLACGKQDFFATCTTKFCDTAAQKELHTTCVMTEGEHNWDYWDPALSESAKWLFE
jgi:putative tributyrin esterase